MIAYAIGAFMLLWCSWFFEGPLEWYRWLEAALWPLAVVFGTVRRVSLRRASRGLAGETHGR